MTTFNGTPAESAAAASSAPIYAQVYCTLAELDEDLNLLGSEKDERVLMKIQAASDYLQKEVGWFLPVTTTRKLNGEGKTVINIPKMTLITTVVNNGTELTTDDYIAWPETGCWPYGPQNQLLVAPNAVNLSTWYDEENGVEVTGHAGMYEYAKNLGALSTASQTDEGTTLQVDDGSILSPGMVILIGQEQEYIERLAAPTTAVTTLSAAMDGEDQTIALVDGSLLHVGEILRLGLEQMRLEDKNGNTGAVTRGWNRTQKTSHASGTNVDVYRTCQVLRGVNGTTAAAHASGLALYRQMVPYDINLLCRKMAGRMLKDSQSGFSGVIGDPAMGTAQYLYILPKELEDIKRNYRTFND